MNVATSLHRMSLGCTVVISLLAVAQASSAKPSISDVQVNQTVPGPFPTNSQREPSLAQNPTNPLNLIAGANDAVGDPPCTDATPSACADVFRVPRIGFYASFDGGSTWPCQGLIDLSAYCSDVYVVWTDSRNATPCQAVDAYRAGTAPKPNVIRECPIAFGNTDIFFGKVMY
jgi:hypothetical protein